MEYLQYSKSSLSPPRTPFSFKPYYKWNTFNTIQDNLMVLHNLSFKPYYKWNTFNTEVACSEKLKELSEF